MSEPSRLNRFLPTPLPRECTTVETLETLLHQWELCPETICRILIGMNNLGSLGTPVTVWVISGRRTMEDQATLKAQGRPAAAPDLSTHVARPGEKCAEGFDVDVYPKHDHTWRLVGWAFEAAGFRWGGGSAKEDGIPSDRGHFDLGPKWREGR